MRGIKLCSKKIKGFETHEAHGSWYYHDLLAKLNRSIDYLERVMVGYKINANFDVD